MLYRQTGSPEENEIVLCKVTKIFPNSVFVNLLEYDESGMIHISEISPGRIRNLRDYVSVGKQIVCKILRIDRQKGHIDLSLRRVNSTTKREKLDEIKQELKSEQLIKNIAKKRDEKFIDLYKKIKKHVFKNYTYIHEAFKEVVDEGLKLEKLGIAKDLAKDLETAILDKFKPEKIYIKGQLSLKTYDSNGVEKIRETLIKVQKVSDTFSLSYLGSGTYKLVIEDLDYKPAEKNLQKAVKIIESFNDKLSTAQFVREKSG